MSIDLRHLEYFVALAEELHFGRAAEAVGVSQPTLSVQIRALEEVVGAPLVHRRPVALTEAGRAFLPGCRRTLVEVGDALRVGRAAADGRSGTLTVGVVPSTFLLPRIPRALRAFRASHPAVETVFREASTASLARAVEDGRADVAVVRRGALGDELEGRTLLRERLVAALPAGHDAAGTAVIPLERLAPEPWVLFPRSVNTELHDHIVAFCRAAGFTPNVVAEVAEVQPRVSLVGAGMGVTVAPAGIRRLRLPGIAYRGLSDARHWRTPVTLCWRKGTTNPRVAALVDAF